MADNNLYGIRDVPPKGKGLFAVTKIPKGTCIITESPLIEIPRESPSHDLLHQIITSQLAKLSEAQRKSFYSLLNSHPDHGEEVGIAETNGLCPGPDAKNGAIFSITSRINHSCKPNAQIQWDEHLKKITVHAIENIEQGQEITVTYLGEPLLAYEQRQEKLKTSFGFDCRCRLCSLSPAGRDLASLRNTTSFPLFSGSVGLPTETELQLLFEKSFPNPITETWQDYWQHSKHWAFIGEITHIEALWRVRLIVKDKSGHEILVAFYTETRGTEIGASMFRVGRAVVILYAAQHAFMDRTVGIRHEDPGRLRILPTSLENLLLLSDKVQSYSVLHNQTRTCHGCKKESDSLMKCSKCGFFWYCNQDCQTRGWNENGHKADCRLLQNETVKGLFLVKWNEFETYMSFPLSV
ncbi:mynd finger and set [Fusarium sporotrichioides]|uniref:Mynd finger and set n=1 Tax=Fusarium sporotrichioides TaxID=5514 RepID=A0A395S973_FUSSP|nr:mynd finger and set [Fusarium sporotrichioides]